MIHREFIDFLKEYKIVSLAIAFIMGSASTSLVNSFVNDVLMPFFAPLLSSGDWNLAILHLGPVEIAIGSFLSALIKFVLLALVVFLVTKKLLKESEKAPLKDLKKL